MALVGNFKSLNFLNFILNFLPYKAKMLFLLLLFSLININGVNCQPIVEDPDTEEINFSKASEIVQQIIAGFTKLSADKTQNPSSFLDDKKPENALILAYLGAENGQNANKMVMEIRSVYEFLGKMHALAQKFLLHVSPGNIFECRQNSADYLPIAIIEKWLEAFVEDGNGVEIETYKIGKKQNGQILLAVMGQLYSLGAKLESALGGGIMPSKDGRQMVRAMVAAHKCIVGQNSAAEIPKEWIFDQQILPVFGQTTAENRHSKNVVVGNFFLKGFTIGWQSEETKFRYGNFRIIENFRTFRAFYDIPALTVRAWLQIVDHFTGYLSNSMTYVSTTHNGVPERLHHWFLENLLRSNHYINFNCADHLIIAKFSRGILDNLSKLGTNNGYLGIFGPDLVGDLRRAMALNDRKIEDRMEQCVNEVSEPHKQDFIYKEAFLDYGDVISINWDHNKGIADEIEVLLKRESVIKYLFKNYSNFGLDFSDDQILMNNRMKMRYCDLQEYSQDYERIYKGLDFVMEYVTRFGHFANIKMPNGIGQKFGLREIAQKMVVELHNLEAQNAGKEPIKFDDEENKVITIGQRMKRLKKNIYHSLEEKYSETVNDSFWGKLSLALYSLVMVVKKQVKEAAESKVLSIKNETEISEDSAKFFVNLEICLLFLQYLGTFTDSKDQKLVNNSRQDLEKLRREMAKKLQIPDEKLGNVIQHDALKPVTHFNIIEVLENINLNEIDIQLARKMEIDEENQVVNDGMEIDGNSHENHVDSVGNAREKHVDLEGYTREKHVDTSGNALGKYVDINGESHGKHVEIGGESRGKHVDIEEESQGKHVDIEGDARGKHVIDVEQMRDLKKLAYAAMLAAEIKGRVKKMRENIFQIEEESKGVKGVKQIRESFDVLRGILKNLQGK